MEPEEPKLYYLGGKPFAEPPVECYLKEWLSPEIELTYKKYLEVTGGQKESAAILALAALLTLVIADKKEETVNEQK